MSDRLSESTHIDCTDDFAHHPRLLAAHYHLGVEARGRCRSRSRADDDRRESEEVIGLHDHGEAATVLDAAAATRERDRMDVTTDHEALP